MSLLRATLRICERRALGSITIVGGIRPFVGLCLVRFPLLSGAQLVPARPFSPDLNWCGPDKGIRPRTEMAQNRRRNLDSDERRTETPPGRSAWHRPSCEPGARRSRDRTWNRCDEMRNFCQSQLRFV